MGGRAICFFIFLLARGVRLTMVPGGVWALFSWLRRRRQRASATRPGGDGPGTTRAREFAAPFLAQRKPDVVTARTYALEIRSCPVLPIAQVLHGLSCWLAPPPSFFFCRHLRHGATATQLTVNGNPPLATPQDVIHMVQSGKESCLGPVTGDASPRIPTTPWAVRGPNPPPPGLRGRVICVRRNGPAPCFVPIGILYRRGGERPK